MIRVSDRPFYKLLKTGQTTQYGGYNDDGLYEMGVAKEYDVLTLGVYSGHTHIILNALDEDHSNECVYDRRTQLMWSRTPCHGHLGPAADGKLPWTTNVNGEGIFAYCAAANAALLAGYADWRVPNLFELLSIADYEQPTGLPDGVAFPGWPAGVMWSATTNMLVITEAFYIYFNGAFVYPNIKTSNDFVSLVRGG